MGRRPASSPAFGRGKREGGSWACSPPRSPRRSETWPGEHTCLKSNREGVRWLHLHSVPDPQLISLLRDGEQASQTPPGLGDSPVGVWHGRAYTEGWGRGLSVDPQGLDCVPLLASKSYPCQQTALLELPFSCYLEPKRPKQRGLWAGEQGRPRGLSIPQRGLCHPPGDSQGSPSRLPTSPQLVIQAGPPERLSPWTTRGLVQGEHRTPEEPIRHHGQASLDGPCFLELGP